MTVVPLEWREVRLAGLAGVDRRLMNLCHRTADRNGAPSRDHGWDIDIQGAIGEMAVAKHFGFYWFGGWPLRVGDGDVGRHQVRSTTLEHGGLIVHPDDPDDVPFILVLVGQPHRPRIVGWMSGKEAKQDRYWRSDVRDPTFIVPQSALHPIAEFVGVT
jgi:hypothetical protein